MLTPDRQAGANSLDSDKTNIWSGFVLFAIYSYVRHIIRSEKLAVHKLVHILGYVW